MRGWVRVFTGLVVLLVPAYAMLAGSKQQNWSPNRYEVRCTGCLPDHVKTDIADGVSRAMEAYRRRKFAAPKNFGVVRNGVIGLVDATTGQFEEQFAFAQRGNPNQIYIGGQLKKPKIWGSEDYVDYFLAHEAFHIVQSDYRAFVGMPQDWPRGQRIDNAARWVREGTADAISTSLIRKWHPSSAKTKRCRWAAKHAGLRPYNWPLNYEFARMQGDAVDQPVTDPSPILCTQAEWAQGPETNTINSNYRTSSFWRHLAEVYHASSYSYFDDFFKESPPRYNWVRWLNDRLMLNPRFSRHLGWVYVRFLSEFATWSEPGRPGEFWSEKDWLDYAFGGCQEVTLTGQASGGPAEVKVPVKLRPLSGTCVRVRVEGVAPGQRGAVYAWARSTRTEDVDQIHLGLAKTDSVDPFDCHSLRGKEKTLGRGPRQCVFKQKTGPERRGGKASGMRVWESFYQDGPAQGKASYENLYVVSRTHHDPTESRGHTGGDLLAVDLHFGLETAKWDLSGGSSTPAAGGKKTRKMASVQREPLTRGRPIVPIRRGKDEVMPSIMAGKAKGISQLFFNSVEIKGATFDFDRVKKHRRLDPNRIIMFPVKRDGKRWVPDPLMVGQTGRRSLKVKTGDGRWVTDPVGTIEVLELTHGMLRARVEAKLCDAVDVASNRPCTSSRRLTGTMVHPHAGLWTRGSSFAAKDTPGQVVYPRRGRRQSSQPGTGNSGSATTGSGPTAPSSGAPSTGSIKCACSCEEYDLINGPRRDDNPAVERARKAALRCKQECAAAFEVCKARR